MPRYAEPLPSWAKRVNATHLDKEQAEWYAYQQVLCTHADCKHELGDHMYPGGSCTVGQGAAQECKCRHFGFPTVEQEVVPVGKSELERQLEKSLEDK